MRQSNRKDLISYYDLMDIWTRYNRGFRRFSGHESNTIHRWLIDQHSGAFSPETVHRLIEPFIVRHAPPVVLDAGCGYGGTALALHRRHGGCWRGVTISARQHRTARALACAAGVAADVTFALASYDDPQPPGFTAIYGIESLVHSSDPARTVMNLCRSLQPGGTFLIVDDMPADEVPSSLAGDLAKFMALWRCPVMPSARGWSRMLEQAGCRIEECRDLSALMRPRSEREISRAIEEVTARRRWRDRLGLRRIGEAEIGGLLLERLGREGAVTYTLIAASRRA